MGLEDKRQARFPHNNQQSRHSFDCPNRKVQEDHVPSVNNQEAWFPSSYRVKQK